MLQKLIMGLLDKAVQGIAGIICKLCKYFLAEWSKTFISKAFWWI